MSFSLGYSGGNVLPYAGGGAERSCTSSGTGIMGGAGAGSIELEPYGAGIGIALGYGGGIALEPYGAGIVDMPLGGGIALAYGAACGMNGGWNEGLTAIGGGAPPPGEAASVEPYTGGIEVMPLGAGMADGYMGFWGSIAVV